MARAKLSNAQKIRAMLKAGVEIKTIAKRLGVAPAYVHTTRWLMKKAEGKAPAKRGRPPKLKAKAKRTQRWQEVVAAVPPVVAEPDIITRPAHYTVGGIETWDFIEAKNLPYHLASVVKYVSRAPYKGDTLTDLRKAREHLLRCIAKLEEIPPSV